MRCLKPVCLLVLLVAFCPSWAQTAKKKSEMSCCAKPAKKTTVKATAETKTFAMGKMGNIPNTDLINQDGKKVKFYDLIKGKVVAVNFIFTTCKTICPVMGANFAGLKKIMASKVKSGELLMLSVSIDPDNDSPERLKAWSKKFSAGPGWTLVTGKRQDVFELLKRLEVYSAVKEEHAPIVLLGKEGSDNWVRANGLSDPKQIAKTLNGFFDKQESKKTESAKNDAVNHDENYFTNVELLDQNGEKKRLYADLMQDKVVIINAFFSECQGVCPVMSNTLQKIQEYLGDRLGKTVNIISMSVDYKTDRPNILKTYAESYKAKDGWYFMTGEPANMELALKKLGKAVDSRDQHDAIFLVGNLKTKLWKKVNGLAPLDQIIPVIESVINDKMK